MLISQFSRFGQVASFDPATGTPTGSRPASPGEHTAGTYDVLSDTLVVLFREGDALLVRVGDRLLPLDGTEIRHGSDGTSCALAIGELTLRYPIPPEWAGLGSDLTPFVELEDFDFGLFVANVANDRARAERLYR